jgi:hypothetical protein
MVNPGMVNAESCVFRRRVFTNLFAFLVEFHDSKIRLNIFARAQLTKKCTVPRGLPRSGTPEYFAQYQYLTTAPGAY